MTATATATASIETVWGQYETEKNQQLRNTLLEYYLPIVKSTASRVHSRLPEKIQIEDVISWGIIGLIDAVDSYDPSMGVRFETYSSQRIRGAILDELRKTDWIPRLVRRRARLLTAATSVLTSKLGRAPADDELAEELRVDLPELVRLRRDAAAIWLLSLNKSVSVDGDREDTPEPQLASASSDADPVHQAQKRDLKTLLTKGLSKIEKLVVVLYYYEEMTMKEIGQTIGISESRVSQIHTNLLRRMRAQIGGREHEFTSAASA